MPSAAPSTADRALRRFFASGAPDALAELFDAAAEPLWRIALHLLGDAARAEDVLQETFLTVLEARHRRSDAPPPREALPWLTGILHNRVRRERRDGARVPDPGRFEESLARLESEDPLGSTERRELVAAVDRELHAPPEVYRPMLRLALQHGLATHEIAATPHWGSAKTDSQGHFELYGRGYCAFQLTYLDGAFCNSAKPDAEGRVRRAGHRQHARSRHVFRRTHLALAALATPPPLERGL